MVIVAIIMYEPRIIWARASYTSLVQAPCGTSLVQWLPVRASGYEPRIRADGSYTSRIRGSQRRCVVEAEMAGLVATAEVA